MHFNLADFPVAFQITAVTFMVMGDSKNVFNFVLYSNCENLMLAKYMYFTVVKTSTEISMLHHH